MREQLIQYVELLFAGAADCEDVKQEILQNTLDRYDDLIAQGKVPEAAYRLAITGIGDINEILGTPKPQLPSASVPKAQAEPQDTPTKKLLRAAAVGLYILCILPLIVLSEMGMATLGFCGTLCFVAVATVMIILGSKKHGSEADEDDADRHPKSELRKSVSSMVWAIGLAAYFLVSFLTMAWHLTWLIFPLVGAVDSLLGVWIASREEGQIPFRKHKTSVNSLISAIGLSIYFVLSFATRAWYITWVIFPMIPAVQGLIWAIVDFKEANDNET